MAAIVAVTGAAGGLGRAISLRLQSDGYKVIGLDIDGTGLNAVPGENFSALQCDLSEPDDITAAFDQIATEYGSLHALVNNAGTCLMSDFPDISADEFDRQMNINFRSAFCCSQAAVKLMQGDDAVRKIVNISSNGAYNFDVFDPPHYRASKAAMDTLTKDLARRYAAERIAVNSIAPAMTETPLFGVLSQETLAKALAQMPHGRAMRPEEVAEWVRFLISPAGDICSGNIIILNQGRDVR